MKKWIKAFRLQTLPLSLSGVLMAIGLAYDIKIVNIEVSILLVLTTVCLQILSNLANDYGDGKKGIDNHRKDRGQLPRKSIKIGVIIFLLLNLGFITWTIFSALELSNEIIVLVALGFVFIIISAIKYTIGKNAYGYRGLGDIFVFIFFGIFSVIGNYFLITQKIDYLMLLPASSVGFLSVAVLNLNNMRDFRTDKQAGKNTLVVKMGINKAKVYHFILIYLALGGAVAYNLIREDMIISFIYIIIITPLYQHMNKVKKITCLEQFAPELKKVALITFVFSILFCLGQIAIR